MALDPYAQWSEMLSLAASPTLKFLVSNPLPRAANVG